MARHGGYTRLDLAAERDPSLGILSRVGAAEGGHRASPDGEVGAQGDEMARWRGGVDEAGRLARGAREEVEPVERGLE